MSWHHINSSHLPQFRKLVLEPLGKHVGDHLVSWAVPQFHSPTADLLPNEVILDCNVLHSAMKLRVFCHTNRCLISSRIVVALVRPLFRSLVSCLIQIASCTALAKAMYSASAVDSATQLCFLPLQLSEHLTQSAAPSLLYSRPKCIVPSRYVSLQSSAACSGWHKISPHC